MRGRRGVARAMSSADCAQVILSSAWVNLRVAATNGAISRDRSRVWEWTKAAGAVEGLATG